MSSIHASGFLLQLAICLLSHRASSSPLHATPQPPPDWAHDVERGHAPFSPKLDLGAYSPNLGNVFIGFNLGCDFEHKVPGDHKSGVMHLAGVFTGRSTASRRADLPGVFSGVVVGGGSAPKVADFVGSALDMQRGFYSQRFRLPGCGGAVVEQR